MSLPWQWLLLLSPNFQVFNSTPPWFSFFMKNSVPWGSYWLAIQSIKLPLFNWHSKASIYPITECKCLVTKAWDRFIDEELLGDMMETITKTSTFHIAYFFVHYGKKSLLSHHPIGQCNGNIAKPTKGMSNYHHQQCRFHKKLSQLVIIIAFSSAIH